MNFIKVEQCAYTDGAGNIRTVELYLNLDNVIAVYPDANLVMTNASLNAPRELASMTLTDESLNDVLKEIMSPLKFNKVLTKEEIDKLRKEMGDLKEEVVEKRKHVENILSDLRKETGDTE